MSGEVKSTAAPCLPAAGLHPTRISSAFALAASKAAEILEAASQPVDLKDRDTLLKSASTSLNSKVWEGLGRPSAQHRGLSDPWPDPKMRGFFFFFWLAGRVAVLVDDCPAGGGRRAQGGRPREQLGRPQRHQDHQESRVSVGLGGRAPACIDHSAHRHPFVLTPPHLSFSLPLFSNAPGAPSRTQSWWTALCLTSATATCRAASSAWRRPRSALRSFASRRPRPT